MNPFKTWKIGLIVLLLSCWLVTVTWAQNDYQTILLDYYTQQMVAHSASLFAATMASFTFITRFIEKASKRGVKSKIVFLMVSALLLGVVIYIAFRIMVYGYLASGTLLFPKSSKSYQSLAEYSNDVSEYVFGEGVFINQELKIYPAPWQLRNLMSHCGSIALFNFSEPFNGFLVSMYLGFFFAYLLFYAFSEEAQFRGWLWFSYFLVPAILGSLGALGYLGFLSNFIWGTALILWYLIGGASSSLLTTKK